MKVDFDNLRISTIEDFNRLVRVIKNNPENGYVQIRYLTHILEDLRSGLVGIACCEDENGDFKEVISRAPIERIDFNDDEDESASKEILIGSNNF
jgi:hypothetical protein